jgi:hypothetical protein
MDPGDPGARGPAASPLDVLRNPRRFFEALAPRPRRLMPPFAVVAATLLLNAIGGAVLLVSGRAGPEGARALEMLGKVDPGSPAFAVGVTLGALTGALVTWAIAWLPLRLAVGAHERLWEVAGFAHAPFLAAAPVQLGLVWLEGGPAGALEIAVSLLATAGSCAVVWSGLRVLAPEAAVRGTAAYVALQVATVGFGLVLGASGGGGSGGGLVM